MAVDHSSPFEDCRPFVLRPLFHSSAVSLLDVVPTFCSCSSSKRFMTVLETPSRSSAMSNPNDLLTPFCCISNVPLEDQPIHGPGSTKNPRLAQDGSDAGCATRWGKPADPPFLNFLLSGITLIPVSTTGGGVHIGPPLPSRHPMQAFHAFVL